MVICDSSSLIHLAGIGRLGLLRELYGKLIVPAAVWREVVEEGKGRPGISGENGPFPARTTRIPPKSPTQGYVSPLPGGGREWERGRGHRR
jgi:hypothetical protein